MVQHGMSGAAVYRVVLNDGGSAYLKTAVREPGRDVSAEAKRIAWLRDKLPVPEVLWTGEHLGRDWLLMTAMPGVPAFDESLRDRLPDVVSAYAAGLQAIHGVPADHCPFDSSQEALLETGRRRVESNLVERDQLEDEHKGLEPGEILATMIDSRPSEGVRVFVHGDYCAPNVLLDPDSLAVTGILDLGRAGKGDPYYDFALAAHSVVINFGEEWVEPFLRSYGVDEIDWARLRWFQLLDELG